MVDEGVVIACSPIALSLASGRSPVAGLSTDEVVPGRVVVGLVAVDGALVVVIVPDRVVVGLVAVEASPAFVVVPGRVVEGSVVGVGWAALAMVALALVRVPEGARW